ncbi:hypothetical protein DL95DRAFT_52582 [Leptodontidium sp. 2 PMI_412]|nr:hypothetical protein DL95DRAFT_52582 [Leptodontidium sp. 2 PMI_412]
MFAGWLNVQRSSNNPMLGIERCGSTYITSLYSCSYFFLSAGSLLERSRQLNSKITYKKYEDLWIGRIKPSPRDIHVKFTRLLL